MAVRTAARPHAAICEVVGVSGVLELAALGWWGVHLARLMFGPVERCRFRRCGLLCCDDVLRTGGGSRARDPRALPGAAGDPDAQGAGAERAVGGDRRRGEARARGRGAGRLGAGRRRRPAAGAARALRAVAWNIQRGARLDDLRRAVVAPPFAGTDLLLLSEVDVGLGRSGNRNVARELAEALGMSYAFGVSYLALTDDFGDDSAGRENTLALSGAAILSRYPIGRVENIDLPEVRDKFHSSEKRLGKKRALLAEIALPDGPLAVAACHLDSNASPAQRARQLGGRPRQRRSQRRGARAGGRRLQHQHLRPLEHAGAGARPPAQAARHRVPRHRRSST